MRLLTIKMFDQVYQVSLQVIEILSRVLQDLVIGELMQLQTTHNLEDRLSHFLNIEKGVGNRCSTLHNTNSRFSEPGDIEEASRLVTLSNSLQQTSQLARCVSNNILKLVHLFQATL